MRTTEQINSFWELAREQSLRGQILRRRITAIGAIALGFSGLLLAIGLGGVVLAFLAVIAASICIAVLLTAWPRLRALGGSGIAFTRARSRTTHERLVPVWHSAVSTSRAALVEARKQSNTLARAAGSQVGRGLGQTAREATTRFVPQDDPRNEALRLNAAGTQQRRDGQYEEAVENHRQALELLRGVGDRRGVALTQSNLALALSHAGDDVWAVGLFEEAAATLHELGDEEDEARIMANLGATHRRHGRPEEGDNVLGLALSKLSPASSAYQAIEAELRRAS